MPLDNEKVSAHEKTAESTVERRFFRSEARAKKSEDGKMTIGGYGSIFNQYTNMGWFAEVVLPGFFDGIKDDRCACLFNHDPSQVLGRKANNTLTLRVDEKGLEYEAKLPASRSDVHELIGEGYIYESSFAFTVAKASWEEVDRSQLAGLLSDSDLDMLTYGGKISVRKLEKGRELFDVSPVTFAAYEGTTTDTRIARRGFEAWKQERRATTETPEPAPREHNHRTRIAEALERAAK